VRNDVDILHEERKYLVKFSFIRVYRYRYDNSCCSFDYPHSTRWKKRGGWRRGRKRGRGGRVGGEAATAIEDIHN